MDNEYLDVSSTAAEVGCGFTILKAPVSLTHQLWDACVKWDHSDNNTQTYQEEDARLWDVLFVCGSTLEMNINNFLSSMIHKFNILVIPRDGESTQAVKAQLVATGNPETGILTIDLLELAQIEQEEW